jgi:predicted double-glycine peptidase
MLYQAYVKWALYQRTQRTFMQVVAKEVHYSQGRYCSAHRPILRC